MNPLRTFLADTVEQVVDLQDRFNSAYEQEFLQLRPFLEAHPDLDPTILTSLVPNRIVVDEYQLQCHLHLEKDRLQKFELNAKALPLQAGILSGARSIQQQRISIAVEQFPIHQNPFSDKP